VGESGDRHEQPKATKDDDTWNRLLGKFIRSDGYRSRLDYLQWPRFCAVCIRVSAEIGTACTAARDARAGSRR
jgi:hypothetical protein